MRKDLVGCEPQIQHLENSALAVNHRFSGGVLDIKAWRETQRAHRESPCLVSLELIILFCIHLQTLAFTCSHKKIKAKGKYAAVSESIIAVFMPYWALSKCVPFYATIRAIAPLNICNH
jgi:hypothetical protein